MNSKIKLHLMTLTSINSLVKDNPNHYSFHCNCEWLIYYPLPSELLSFAITIDLKPLAISICFGFSYIANTPNSYRKVFKPSQWQGTYLHSNLPPSPHFLWKPFELWQNWTLNPIILTRHCGFLLYFCLCNAFYPIIDISPIPLPIKFSQFPVFNYFMFSFVLFSSFLQTISKCKRL